jgi:hypothetical protein
MQPCSPIDLTHKKIWRASLEHYWYLMKKSSPKLFYGVFRKIRENSIPIGHHNNKWILVEIGACDITLEFKLRI